ncbi:DUF3995 domain-containing protein [Streptomyces pactum]|uniref:DUF3995 domain-containing protein n=1 Tax=Streptomyces pactum TaxID=68249 RepID=A0ABS0NMI9_9ACTN|nr:DUF3995 domain-containing protein [Streptomyces pactum]MBH5336425.1 DUF3995 domain-containing protein [Streptomyces pactum]
MTNAASLLLAAALLFVGALHFLWAAGVYWPAASKEDLTRKVLSDSEEIPSPPLTALVAAFLAGAAYVAVAAHWDGLRIGFLPDWLYTLGIWGLVAVMALRGLVEPFFASTGNEVYTRLNRRAYAPFCVVLALLGVVVALG